MTWLYFDSLITVSGLWYTKYRFEDERRGLFLFKMKPPTYIQSLLWDLN